MWLGEEQQPRPAAAPRTPWRVRLREWFQAPEVLAHEAPRPPVFTLVEVITTREGTDMRRYSVTLLVEGDDLTTLDQVRTLVDHRVDELGDALGMAVLDSETVEVAG